MARTAVVALAFLALMAGPAQATDVPGRRGAGLHARRPGGVQTTGAVGLLNPGAGPETSARAGDAALVARRGPQLAARRRPDPPGAPVFPLDGEALTAWRATSIYVGLPEGGRQPNDKRYPILVSAPASRGCSRRTRPGFRASSPSPTSRRPRADRRTRWVAAGRRHGLESCASSTTRIDENNGVRLPHDPPRLRARPRPRPLSPAAAVPGFAAALLANLVLGRRGVSDFWTVMAVLAVAVLSGARCSPRSSAHRLPSGASSSPSSAPTCSRWGSTAPRRPSHPSARHRTPATSGSPTSSRRCSSCRPSAAPRSSSPARLGRPSRHGAPRVRDGGREPVRRRRRRGDRARRRLRRARGPARRRRPAGARDRRRRLARSRARARRPRCGHRAARATSRRLSRTVRWVWPETSVERVELSWARATASL